MNGFEYLLIWATVGSTETLLAVRKAMRGKYESLTIETAGLSGGSFADIARRIELACKISAEGFTNWIDSFIDKDQDQHPDFRGTVFGYPNEEQYDDFQIIRWVKCEGISPREAEERFGNKAATVIYTDMLGDDPDKVKQSRAAEVIDKLARLARLMESATVGYAGLKRVTVYSTDEVFEALTEAIELLQDAYEENGGD